MASNFLTPAAIWKGYVKSDFKTETVRKVSSKGVLFSHVKLRADKIADGEAEIYGVLAHSAQISIASPALLLIQDFKKGADTELARVLAEAGYIVFTPDLAGATEFNLSKHIDGVEAPYTAYSDNISYAVYDEEAESAASIENDARSTCWYVWGRVIRVCAEYLRSLPSVCNVGAIGIGAAATPLWQALTSDFGFSCAAIIANAGWKGYRGTEKFGENSEPEFNDDALKYLAGIEPQAYAAHVKCPLMFVAPTNSPEFDLDRAYDTVSRIPESFYTAVDYSVGERYVISAECFNGIKVFLNAFMSEPAQVAKKTFPTELTIKGAAEGDVITAEVLPDRNGLKNVYAYFAEGEKSPKLRSWQKTASSETAKNGAYVFKYSPFVGSGNVMFFARAEYENGISVCSPVLCKKIAAEGEALNKHRVLYSSRMPFGLNGFYPAAEKDGAPKGDFGVCLDKNAALKIKNGPMDISGVYCPKGVLTFKVNAKKYKPDQGAMLMLDVFVKGGGDLYVKAIADYYGSRTEYCAQVKVFGDLWQNVQLENNNFKTAEGMGLKSYDNIEALEFSADADFCINNLLWI